MEYLSELNENQANSLTLLRGCQPLKRERPGDYLLDFRIQTRKIFHLVVLRLVILLVE